MGTKPRAGGQGHSVKDTAPAIPQLQWEERWHQWPKSRLPESSCVASMACRLGSRTVSLWCASSVNFTLSAAVISLFPPSPGLWEGGGIQVPCMADACDTRCPGHSLLGPQAHPPPFSTLPCALGGDSLGCQPSWLTFGFHWVQLYGIIKTLSGLCLQVAGTLGFPVW